MKNLLNTSALIKIYNERLFDDYDFIEENICIKGSLWDLTVEELEKLLFNYFYLYIEPYLEYNNYEINCTYSRVFCVIDNVIFENNIQTLNKI